MESFVISKSGANKILSCIRKVKHKESREEKLFYLVNCLVSRTREPNSLYMAFKEFYRKSDSQAKRRVEESDIYKNASKFWTPEYITIFEESSEFFIRARRAVAAASRDFREEKDEEVIPAPKQQELQNIILWFKYMFPINHTKTKKEAELVQ